MAAIVHYVNPRWTRRTPTTGSTEPGLPRPKRQIPIWLGGSSEAAFDRAARIGESVDVLCFPDARADAPIDRLARRHQRCRTEYTGHSLQVIGQDVEAHLGSDLVECPGQEMGGAHPGLESPERVFDGLSPHVHGRIRSRRSCILSSTSSFTQRLIIRRLVGMHRGLSGPVKQALRWR
jgi:hypothetical protein